MSSSVINVGDYGIGVFNQTDGTIDQTAVTLTIGNHLGTSGILNLSGAGEMLPLYERIGSGGAGTFVQMAD